MAADRGAVAGALTTSIVPPKAPRRSRMLTKPWPAPARRRGVEAGAVVGDLPVQGVGVLPHAHAPRWPRRRRACRRSAAPPCSRSRPPPRPRGRSGRRRCRSVVGSAARPAAAGSASASPPDIEQRREDAVGQRAQLGDRVLQVRPDLVDHRHRVVGVVLDRRPWRGAASRPAPRGAAGRRRGGCARACAARRRRRPRCAPATRCSSSLVLAQLVERGLQGGVELHVVQRQADLAGQLGEHPVVLLGERLAVGGALARR